jgi:bacterioferritin-associated ferredoxin
MIVCMCYGKSERDVDAEIRAGADSVEAIGDRCGAGTACGACVEEIAQRLGGARAGGCGGSLARVRSGKER